MPITIEEAVNKAIDEQYNTGMIVIAPDDGPCKVCGKVDDRRFGVCMACKDKALIDGDWVYEIANPSNRWSKVRITGNSESN